jgi:hypothetical protein
MGTRGLVRKSRERPVALQILRHLLGLGGISLP